MGNRGYRSRLAGSAVFLLIATSVACFAADAGQGIQSYVDKYGPLARLVLYAGFLTAATAAIIRLWRSQAAWEPCEEDIPQGSLYIGGVISGIAIVFIWGHHDDPSKYGFLMALAWKFVVGMVGSFLFYGYLIGTQVFDQDYSPEQDKTLTRKIIGGFWLLDEARKYKTEHSLSIQDLLKGRQNNPDNLWSRPSRTSAKLVFILCYWGITVSGTSAVSAGAALLMIEKAPTVVPTFSKHVADIDDAGNYTITLSWKGGAIGNGDLFYQLLPGDSKESTKIPCVRQSPQCAQLPKDNQEKQLALSKNEIPKNPFGRLIVIASDQTYFGRSEELSARRGAKHQ